MKIQLYDLLGEAFHDLADDVREHGHTHYDLSGGRGSLKSSCISLLVPLLMIRNPNYHACVFRKVGNTIRDSVFQQYIWAIDKLGMAPLWDSKTSPPELIYRPTGQRILFRGADDPMKLKSIKVPFGYIAITHFEEKDQFGGRKEIRTILQSTMRGGDTFWNFESYNPPITRENWANLDSMEVREDRLCHKSTYLQAPPEWLGEQFLAEAEYVKETNEREYRHEYLGEAVGSGGEVFENLEIREITDDEVKRFDHVYNGVDWGWFPDPWAFNRVHYDSARRIVYIFDEARENKMYNEATANLLKSKGMTSNDLITADSAEPKSCADYNKFGLRCAPAIKGPGSVEAGMKWLQSRAKIVIDPARCKKTAQEFSCYEYERTKDGDIISGYPDRNNHNIDAVRYALERVWRVPGEPVYRKYISPFGGV